MIKLSILIPSTHDRDGMLYNLVEKLKQQCRTDYWLGEVEVITNVDNGELSIGNKRQMMIEQATGEFISFIDSDDEVSGDYIRQILTSLKTNPDVISFNGYMTTDGGNMEKFKIGKDLPYITISDAFGNKEYLRFNNHLSPIKREIALKIGYKDLRFAEDYDYAVRLRASNLIEKEVKIEAELYHYRYIKNK